MLHEILNGDEFAVNDWKIHIEDTLVLIYVVVINLRSGVAI